MKILKPSLALAVSITMLAPAWAGAPAAVSAANKTPAEYVNTLIGPGTSSTVAGPTLPNGSIHPSPETRTCKNGGYTPGNLVVGFGQLYAQGTGGTQSYGNFLLAPMTGNVEMSDANRASAITDELGTANYYTATLSKYGIKAEVTPTENAAIYRFTYPANGSSSLLLDISRKIGDLSALNNGSITIDPATGTITGGGRFQNNWNPAQWDMYFALQFDKTPAELGVWDTVNGLQNGVYTDSTASTGVRIGAYAKFGTAEGETVSVKLAVSFVSAAKAKAFLDAQIPAWDFDAVRRAGLDKWNAVLGRVELGAGVSEAQKEKFYTAMWHANVQPRNRISDHGEWDDYYTIWDSWKTVFPFQTLTRPDLVAANINSFISRYNKNKGANQYGYMSDAYIQGKEYICGQGGNDIENIIADAYIKNIPGVDWEAAYQAVYGEAQTMRTAPYVNGGYQNSTAAKTAQNGMAYSYRLYPSSATMGFAQNDYSAGIMARGLGKADDAAFFLNRAGSWKNLWDPGLTLDGVTGLAHNKNQNGTFAATGGSPIGYNNDFYEASLWEGSYYPIWDVDSMVGLMGGKYAFASRLAYDLSKGHIDFGNEPSFQTIWLLCSPQVKRPDLASQYVQQFLSRFPQNGYPGDEDNGAMSTMYMFLMSGFFPFSTTNTYYLHGARLPEITYHLANGKDFKIKGVNASPANIYVQSAALNGEPLGDPWITYDQIMAGGELDFVMGGAPSRWGRDPADPSSMPTDITNLQAAVSGNGSVTLTWGPAEDKLGIANYMVYRGLDEDFTPSDDNLVGTAGTAATYTEQPGFGIFYYKVLAENNDGNLSLDSPCAHAVTFYAGTPPAKYAGSLMFGGCVGRVSDQAAAAEGAAQAFDANDSTKWSARVVAPGVPDMSETDKYLLGSMWLKVDMLDECSVTGWIVQNEQSSVLSEFYLQVLDDQGEWRDVRHITGNTHINNNDPFTETLPAPVTGRYFRLLIPVLGANQTTDNARIKEFHLFGTRISGEPKTYSVTVLPPVGAVADVSVSETQAAYNDVITVDITGIPDGFAVNSPGLSYETGAGAIPAARVTAGVPAGAARYTFVMPPRRVTVQPVIGAVYPPPTAVTGLAADGSALGVGWVKLTWDPASHPNGIAKYRVYRGKSGDFIPAADSLIGETAITSFVDAPDLSGYYFYKIVAVSADGTESEPTGCFYVNVALPANALYGATADTNIALGKTAAANGYAAPLGTTDWQYASMAVDGSMTTKWSCRRTGTPNQGSNTDEYGNFWLQLDLGSPYVIGRWVVKHAHAGGEGANLNTRDFVLQAQAGDAWVDIDPVTGNAADITDRSVKPFTARIIRLYVTKPEQGDGGNPRIYEFELYSPAAPRALTGVYAGSLTAFKPGWVSDQAAADQGAAQAVDCNDGTKWSARVVAPGIPDMSETDKYPLGAMWLKVDLGAVYTVGSYYISNEGGSNLRDYYVQAMDPLGKWIDAVHDTAQHNGTAAFRGDFPAPVSGRYFRLLLPVVGTNQTTDNARIREFHLFPAAQQPNLIKVSVTGGTASVAAGKTSALPGETVTIDVSGVGFGQRVAAVSASQHGVPVAVTEVAAGAPEGVSRYSFIMPPCPVDAVVAIGPDPDDISADGRVVIIPDSGDFPAGEFSPRFSVTASEAMSVNVIAAAYDAGGKLLAVDSQSAGLTPFETAELGARINTVASAKIYKCFIWDSDYKPLTREPAVYSAVENLALNAAVRSTDSQAGNDAANAVDGDRTATRWAAASAGYPRWIEVDLGREYDLDTLDIYWYVSGARAYQYRVWGRTAPIGDWGAPYPANKNFSADSDYFPLADNSANAAPGHTSDALNNRVARYVAIEVLSSTGNAGNASIFSIEISGGLQPASH